jgi:parallel beta-helix repeat protein
MNHLKTILAISVFTIFSSNLFGGLNYYVSTAGNNSFSGLSISSPFKTINYAISKALHGDTINVMAGTYTNLSYGNWDPYKSEQAVRVFNKKTTTGLYLVIKAYKTDKVILKSDGNFVFQIQKSNFIKVEGFEIIGEKDNISMDTALWYQFQYRQCLNADCSSFESKFRVPFGTPPSVVAAMTLPILNDIVKPTTVNSEGILVSQSDHVDVINNKVHHMPSAGIRIGSSDYCNVIGNTIFECNKRNSVGTPALVLSTIHSIDNNDATKIVVARNRVFDNRNEIYSWSATKTFIKPEIDEGKGISLEHCITRSAEPSWHHGRVRIENNICYRNGFSGINTNEAERVDVLFNTCYNNKASGIGANLGISINETRDARIYNNIVHAVNTWGGYALAVRPLTNVTNDNILFKNNLIVGTLDKRADSVDVNTIFSNPNWVDTLEFRLHSGSVARNSAVDTLTPSLDHFSQQRNDGDPDIGAVEYKPGCNAIVTNNNNSGSGSLRNVLECVAEGDSITFLNSVKNINLNSTLNINKSITLLYSSQIDKPNIIANMGSISMPVGIQIKENKTVKITNIDFKAINNSQKKPLIENSGILVIKGSTNASSTN